MRGAFVPSTLVRMSKKSPGKTKTVRISAHIARMIEIISAADEISAAEILGPMIEAEIETWYAKSLKKLADEGKQLQSKPKRRHPPTPPEVSEA